MFPIPAVKEASACVEMNKESVKINSSEKSRLHFKRSRNQFGHISETQDQKWQDGNASELWILRGETIQSIAKYGMQYTVVKRTALVRSESLIGQLGECVLHDNQ